MLSVVTLVDLILANVKLDILEMVKLANVKLDFLEMAKLAAVCMLLFFLSL